MTSISFCITTSGTNDDGIRNVISNIESLGIPEYEIIYCGGFTTTIEQTDKIKHVPFDENSKAHVTLHGHTGRWTTKKKNLCVEAAKNEIVVVMHDYIFFHPTWWQEFKAFGTHWDVCVHQCLLSNGVRADGWRIDRHPMLPRWSMVPYDMEDLVQYMGLQGNYNVVKRERWLETPLNEDLLWGEEEEMEWSRRIVPISHIRCNPKCIVQYNKPRPDDHNHSVDYQTMLNNEHIFNQLRACRMENFKLVRD